ncbi:MAG: hypothetical protein J7L45_01240, partial [Candidatus Aenigmarchaeota archaeon]|nr:hypothetical protein [Candidatus Aenigmarchaeota archaeon]
MGLIVDLSIEEYFRRHSTGLNGIDCIDLENIREEIDREEQKFNEIINKVFRGEKITPQEEKYIKWYL